MLRITPSMISRITNAAVLEKAGVSKLSMQMLKRQLVLFGRIAAMSPDSLVRKACLEEERALPVENRLPRRRGRPRLTWAKHLHSIALQLAGGSQQQLDGEVRFFPNWCRLVKNKEMTT